MTNDEEANIDWSLTTWKGSRLQQHREFHALPFRKKLEIIEGLGEVAGLFQKQREHPDHPSVSLEMDEPARAAVAREEPDASPD